MGTGKFLIYGATGYTGKLTARFAKEQGLSPILAGRNREKTKEVADLYGFEWRVFGLEETEKLEAALNGVDVVLNTAGPFNITSKPIANACLRTGRHYLDITGDVMVFEDLARCDAEAKAKGVMIMPGVGFDVASDCLSAHLKHRMPDATHLKIILGVVGLPVVSRGTAKTRIGLIDQGTLVRRDGHIIALADTPRTTADFGNGLKATMGVSWGDVSTAWYSTGIPNIEAYMQLTPNTAWLSKIGPITRFILSTSLVQRFLKMMINRIPEGPNDEQRLSSHGQILGEVANEAGVKIRSILDTPEMYTMTVLAALEIAKQVVVGNFKPGFQTPSLVYGADFILQFPGVSRRDG